MLSACLPYLAHVFGKGLLDAFRTISTTLGQLPSFFGFHRGTDSGEVNSDTIKPGTQRATYESYEMDRTAQHWLPELKREAASQESTRQLV